MNQKLIPSILICALCLTTSNSYAQGSDDDAIFELSPFEVDGSGYRGYGTSWAKQIEVDTIELGITSAQLRSPLMQTYPSSGNAPVSLVKPVDEVSLRFAYSFYHDSESIRRKTLQTLIDEIERKAGTQDSLRFVPERLIIKKGDRTKSLRKRRAEYTSHAYFSIAVKVTDRDKLNESLERARTLAEEVEIDEEFTRLFHGEVDWIFRMNPGYRDELLDAIHKDLNRQREIYGANYEVSLSHLSSSLQAKLVSETEAQIWIPYSYTIQSLRGLEQQRGDLELQHAQKWIQIATSNR